MNARQIHCFSDCMSLAIERDGRYDYRPVYIGVWEYPFQISPAGLSYYSVEIRPEGIFEDMAGMYGSPFSHWLEGGMTKSQGFSALEREMQSHRRVAVIVMVDLYHLPYSIHCGKRHFPHLVLVGGRANGQWRVSDPYFNWEGELADHVVQQSLGYEDMVIGVTVNLDEMHEPDWRKVSEVYGKYDNRGASVLSAAVGEYLRTLMLDRGDEPWKDIHPRLEEIGVLSKRIHGLAPVISYFADGQDRDVDALLKQVSELVKRWENFMLTLFRLGIFGKTDRNGLRSAADKLQPMAELELSIKRALGDCFEQWREFHEGSAGRANQNRIYRRAAQADQ